MARSKFNGTPFKPFNRPERGYFYRKRGLPCDGCNKTCLMGVDYYMVHDRVWKGEAGIDRTRCMLCIACLETRLGRSLVLADFPGVPVNVPIMVKFVMQARFRESGFACATEWPHLLAFNAFAAVELATDAANRASAAAPALS